MQQGNQSHSWCVTCLHKVHEYLHNMGTTVHNIYMRSRPYKLSASMHEGPFVKGLDNNALQIFHVGRQQ